MDANPLMGCLIEVGFEGGHGAASIIGESFNKLGFPNGLDLGLAMATMGLLSSSILGSIFIFIGRTLGLSDTEEILEQKDTLNGKNKIRNFCRYKNFYNKSWILWFGNFFWCFAS